MFIAMHNLRIKKTELTCMERLSSELSIQKIPIRADKYPKIY